MVVPSDTLPRDSISGGREHQRAEGGLVYQCGRPQRDPERPLVSIVTVVLNAADHLGEAMQSVFEQDYPNLEYIVIDGGSTDGSLEIIRQNEAKINHWVSEPDEGIYDAMNKGIHFAQGEIIGLLNADDLLYSGVVSRVVDAMGQEPQRKYTCGAVDLIDARGRVYGRSSALAPAQRIRRRFREMPCPHLSVFVGRDLYREIGSFDTRFRLSADYDFLLKLIAQNATCCELQFAVGAFRSGGHSGGMATWRETRQVLRRHGVGRVPSAFAFYRSVSRYWLARVLPVSAVKLLKGLIVSKNRYEVHS